MNLENQVVSLELAKKLKELGVKQESLYWWVNEYQEMKGGISASTWLLKDWKEAQGYKKHISAFIVAELVNELQIVAKEDIIVALDDKKVADTLGNLLCTKLQSLRENVGNGLMQ